MSLADTLKEMDKEFGGYDVEDGMYFVTLDHDSCQRWEPEDGGDSCYIIKWKVDGGDSTGKSISDFLRWSGETEGSTKARRGTITGMIKGVTLHTDDDQNDAIGEAIVALRKSSDADSATDALENLVSAFGTVRMPIRLVTKEVTKDGQTKTFQNVRYIERGHAIAMTDPRELAAVTV